MIGQEAVREGESEFSMDASYTGWSQSLEQSQAKAGEPEASSGSPTSVAGARQLGHKLSAQGAPQQRPGLEAEQELIPGTLIWGVSISSGGSAWCTLTPVSRNAFLVSSTNCKNTFCRTGIYRADYGRHGVKK